MNLDAYDDMMGLEFGEYEGLEAFISPEMIREALLASTAGGGAILLTTWGVKQLNERVAFLGGIQNPLVKAAVNSALTFLTGVIGGRALYEYNRDAAMGVVGGLGGVAMAHLLDALIAKFTGNAPMGISLGEGDMSYDNGMSALAMLETTGVTAAPGAFQDASVTPEALFGLDGTVVQQETLGGYAPYLS